MMTSQGGIWGQHVYAHGHKQNSYQKILLGRNANHTQLRFWTIHAESVKVQAVDGSVRSTWLNKSQFQNCLSLGIMISWQALLPIKLSLWVFRQPWVLQLSDHNNQQGASLHTLCSAWMEESTDFLSLVQAELEISKNVWLAFRQTFPSSCFPIWFEE